MFASSKCVILRSEATKNLVFGKQVTRDAKNETLRLRLRVTIAGRQSINTKQGDHRIWQLEKEKCWLLLVSIIARCRLHGVLGASYTGGLGVLDYIPNKHFSDTLL